MKKRLVAVTIFTFALPRLIILVANATGCWNGITSAAVLPGTTANFADFEVLGSLDFEGIVSVVFVQEHYAYVGVDNGLIIVDVTDPTRPTRMGALQFTDGAEPLSVYAIHVAGHHAYVGVWGGLHVIDVSDPTIPTQVGHYVLPSSSPLSLGSWISNVVVAGQYAFVVVVTSLASVIYPFTTSLTVLDVSNLDLITEVGSYGQQYPASNVAVVEQYACFVGKDVYYPTEYLLKVMDAANPAALVEVGSCSLSNRFGCLELEVQDGHIYISDAGLSVIDVSDPTAPAQIGRYDYDTRVTDIALGHHHAYLASNTNLVGVDVTNPEAPVEVGKYTLSEHINDVAVADSTIYVASGHTLLLLRYNGMSITGHINDVNGRPFSDVAVSAGSDISATTDVDGRYAVSGLNPGVYTLTPALPGYAFWPPNRTATIPPSAVGQDFTLVSAPVSATLSLSGTLWLPYTLTYTDTQGLPTHLAFPANAVDQATTVVVTPTLTWGGAGWAFTGHAFDLAAYRDSTLQVGLALGAPVTATIHYSDGDVRVITDEEALSLRWWDGGGWVDAATSCGLTTSVYQRDIESNVLSAPICRTGRYALLGPTHQVFLPLTCRN